MAKAKDVITTHRQCESAKPSPDGKRRPYSIGGSPGLQLRVSPTVKAWSMIYRPPGSSKQSRLSFGEFPAVGIADAKKKAMEARIAVRDGIDPGRKPAAAKPGMTFADLAEAYMTGHSEPEKRTHREDRRTLDARLIPVIGKMEAKDVTDDHVMNIVDEHAKTSKAQADRTKALISSIYNWGKKKRLIKCNPADCIPHQYTRKRRTTILSSKDFVLIWRYLEQDSGTETQKIARIIIKLAILLGQRRTQLAGAKKRELRELRTKHSALYIPGSRNKNKDELHVVPLPPMAEQLFIDAMEATEDRSEFVFSSVSDGEKPIHPDTVTDEFAAMCKVLNIKDATLHDARHTFKTELSRLKIKKDIREKITSHKSGTADMSEWYDHYDYFDEKLEALQKWESHLMELIKNASADLKKVECGKDEQLLVKKREEQRLAKLKLDMEADKKRRRLLGVAGRDMDLPKKDWKLITHDELRDAIDSYPVTHLAVIYSISDAAVHKRMKSLGIPKKPKGYWLKKGS